MTYRTVGADDHLGKLMVAMLLAISCLFAVTAGFADSGDGGAPARRATHVYDAPGTVFESVAKPTAIPFHAYDAPDPFRVRARPGFRDYLPQKVLLRSRHF